MKSNVGECELSQHCVWRPHSIMGYLSDGINHSATVMHNAVKQNFTAKNIPTWGYLMTVVVWWGRLFIKCQSPSSLRRREKSKQQTKYNFNSEMAADADARECYELSGNLWTVVSFWKQMVASARSHPDLLVTSGVTNPGPIMRLTTSLTPWRSDPSKRKYIRVSLHEIVQKHYPHFAVEKKKFYEGTVPFLEMDYTLSTSRKSTAKMLCHLLFKLTGRSEGNCPLKDKHPASEPGKAKLL